MPRLATLARARSVAVENANFLSQCQCCHLNCTVPRSEECQGPEKSFCVPSTAVGACILRDVLTPKWCGFAAIDNGLVGDEEMNRNAGKDSKGSNCNAGSRSCTCLNSAICGLGLECRVEENGTAGAAAVKRCFPAPGFGSAGARRVSSALAAVVPALLWLL
jgi:hypothetical protein